MQAVETPGRFRSCAVVFGATAFSCLLQLVLSDALPPGSPYTPYYLSVAVSLFAGGPAPGLGAVGAGALLGTLLSPSPASDVALLLYLLSGAVFCALFYWREERNAILLKESLSASRSAQSTAEDKCIGIAAELQQERARLQAMLGAAKDEVWLFDKDGRVVLTNSQRPNPVQPFNESHPALASALHGETIDSEESHAGRSYRIVPVRDERSGELHGAAAAVRDFELQRHAQREAEHLKRELQELINSVPGTAVSIKDLEGRYIVINSYWEKLFGVNAEALPGKTDYEILGQEQADLAARRERNIVAERNSLDVNERLRAADGKEHLLSTRIFPLIDSEDRVYGICTVANDVTATAELREELERARKDAALVAHSKEQLISVLSHELRTPLTPVLAAVALMQREYPDLSERLSVIRRNVELEARLIDDLLDLTKLARGQIPLKKERTDVRRILESVFEMCRKDMESKRINFHAEVADSMPLDGDVARVQQIFWNILRNAVKFTPPGGCIGVRSGLEDGKVVTEVLDSGIGIDAESVQRIFNAFEHGDVAITRRFGGAGLGLPIAKRLVEMHGGTITAQSHGLGLGSLFRINLPKSLTAEAAKSSEASKGDRFPLRILLVEDHKDTAQLIRMLLESAGYKVEVAGNVSAALDLAHEKEFDVLVSDLGLPDRSGLDLMRQLRKEGRHLKGIAVSGFGADEDLYRSKDAGFAEHLVKPVDLDVLTETVEKVAYI